MLCGRSLYPHTFTWQLGSPPPSLNPASIKVQFWVITCIRWIRRFLTTTTVEMERLTIQSSNIKSNQTVSNLLWGTGQYFFSVRLANLNTTFLLSFFLPHLHGALYKDILTVLCHQLQWHRDMVLRRHKLIIWEKALHLCLRPYWSWLFIITRVPSLFCFSTWGPLMNPRCLSCLWYALCWQNA